MTWVPAASDAVLVLAIPLLRTTGAPSGTLSAVNSTVPVGVALPDTGSTVAVKLTLWATSDGFTDEPTLVVVATGSGTAGAGTMNWPKA